MSRSGYEDWDDNNQANLYRGNVQRAIDGQRGQKFLRELLSALDGMEDKRLCPNDFRNSDGHFCTLGVMAQAKGIKTDDLGIYDGVDVELLGKRFNIAPCLAAEIMYLNDEYFVRSTNWITGEPIAQDENSLVQRWQKMREWVLENLKETK